MSHRTATWVAWSLWVVCAALIALAVLLDFLTADVPLLPGEGLLRLGSGLAVLTGVLSLAYPTVGALIASRLPTNPIGWIFCGVGGLAPKVHFEPKVAVLHQKARPLSVWAGRTKSIR
jgi:hypothetical protein